MGCGPSQPNGSGASNHEQAVNSRPTGSGGGSGGVGGDATELGNSNMIDRELDRKKQQEELKIKLLLLGAGESGKSTIFKQMRILYGSPRTEDDLRMYGVVVRSNVITAMRKLCNRLRDLGLEDQLSQEPTKAEAAANASGGGAAPPAPAVGADSELNMSPRQAYDLLVGQLAGGPGISPPPSSHGDGGMSNGSSNGGSSLPANDWVGHSPRAGLGPNNDAQLFLKLWRPMKVLWEVSRNKLT